MTSVSIVMPAYNAEAFIERALCSALGQSLRDIEVLVVDDGSTDRTAERVTRLTAADDRLRLIRLARNGGHCAARNVGIAEAKGEWIANLDADDWYAPDRLERMLAAEAEQPAEIVADNLAFIAEGATQPWQTLLPETGAPAFRMSPEAYLIGDMRNGEKSLGLFHPIIRRRLLEAHGLRYRPDIRTGGDSEFLLRCLARTPDMLVLREPSYLYVVRPDSVSRRRNVEQLRQIKPHIDELVQHFGHNPAMQDLLRERSRRLETYIRVKTVSDPLRQAHWTEAFTALRRDLAVLPSFAIFTLVWLWNGLRRRLGSYYAAAAGGQR